MTFKKLLENWALKPAPRQTREAYAIPLDLDDAARIHALSDLFPGVSQEHIITDLLSAALDQVEAAIPYEPGDTIIREDEFGDPVYSDKGLTPRFLELVRKHRAALDDTE